VRRNPPLQGDVTEHRWLLLIISSHASFDAIPLPNWVFPQPAKPPQHPGEGETTWNPPAVPPVAPAVCVVRFAEHIWRLETHLLSALFHINLNNGWARPRIVAAGF
ncbi:MAG: hypothetical protein ABSF14_15220, partial [Terriglobia bacterium]